MQLQLSDNACRLQELMHNTHAFLSESSLLFVKKDGCFGLFVSPLYVCLPVCLFFWKKCLQEVSIPWQQGPVSHAHTPLFNGVARPSLWILDMLLHGVPHRHSRETGTSETHLRGNDTQFGFAGNG